MRSVIVWLLRIPFLVIALFILPLLFNASSMQDLMVAIGGISLCSGIVVAAGFLNKPLSDAQQKRISGVMSLCFIVAAVGISLGTS